MFFEQSCRPSERVVAREPEGATSSIENFAAPVASIEVVEWRGEDVVLAGWRAILSGELEVVASAAARGARFLLLQRPDGASRPGSSFSPRDIALLARAATGVLAKVNALEVGLSAARLSELTTSLLRRLGLRSRRELVWLCRGRTELVPAAHARIGRVASTHGDYSVLGFPTSAEEVTGPLTPRERDVVRAVLQGMSNPQIATGLGVNVRTVLKLLADARRRLGVESRYALVLESLRFTNAPIAPASLPPSVAAAFDRQLRTARADRPALPALLDCKP